MRSEWSMFSLLVCQPSVPWRPLWSQPFWLPGTPCRSSKTPMPCFLAVTNAQSSVSIAVRNGGFSSAIP